MICLKKQINKTSYSPPSVISATIDGVSLIYYSAIYNLCEDQLTFLRKKVKYSGR